MPSMPISPSKKESKMTEETVSRRELRLAETVSHGLADALVRRKLVPAFSNFFVTNLAGITPLSAVG